MKNFIRAIAAVSASALAVSAHAALPEGVLTAVTAVGTDAAALGAAVLVVLIGIKAFKMIRGAM